MNHNLKNIILTSFAALSLSNNAMTKDKNPLHADENIKTEKYTNNRIYDRLGARQAYIHYPDSEPNNPAGSKAATYEEFSKRAKTARKYSTIAVNNDTLVQKQKSQRTSGAYLEVGVQANNNFENDNSILIPQAGIGFYNKKFSVGMSAGYRTNIQKYTVENFPNAQGNGWTIVKTDNLSSMLQFGPKAGINFSDNATAGLGIRYNIVNTESAGTLSELVRDRIDSTSHQRYKTFPIALQKYRTGFISLMPEFNLGYKKFRIILGADIPINARRHSKESYQFGFKYNF